MKKTSKTQELSEAISAKFQLVELFKMKNSTHKPN